jgi:uncharacterized RDD family membrane protein YckC
MPQYRWICHICSAVNAAMTETCATCGSPATLTGYQVHRRRSQLAAGQPLSDDTVAQRIPRWLPQIAPVRYPSLLRRYVASLIDVVFLITLVGVVARAPLYKSPSTSHIYLLAAVLVYEPFLTSWLCTIGQALMRFRVRDFGTGHRIPVWRGYVRFVVKWPLGLISFITLPARADRRAIHDLVASTIVVESAYAQLDRAPTPV